MAQVYLSRWIGLPTSLMPEESGFDSWQEQVMFSLQPSAGCHPHTTLYPLCIEAICPWLQWPRRVSNDKLKNDWRPDSTLSCFFMSLCLIKTWDIWILLLLSATCNLYWGRRSRQPTASVIRGFGVWENSFSLCLHKLYNVTHGVGLCGLYQYRH